MTVASSRAQSQPRPLRVCLVAFSGYPDQGMTFFYEAAVALARLGHDVTAFAVGRDGEPADSLEQGVRVHRRFMPLSVNWASPARWGRKARFLLEAARFLRAGRFDLVHVYCTIGSGLLPLLAGRDAKWVLEHQTGAVSQHRRIVRMLENRARALQGLMYDVNFTVSDVLGKRLFGRGFEVVPAGVNLRAFRPGLPRDLRAELGIPGDHIVFVLAGTLESMRGSDVPIRALARALERDDRLWLFVAGKGSMLDDLRALASALGVERRVWLPGYVPYAQIPRVFAAADAGISFLPPLDCHEGQPPMKVMEYLGAGLPVIATDIPSHHDRIGHDRNGLLVPPTVEGVADAMTQFAGDPQLRARLAAAAAPSVAHLTWDAIARERVVPTYLRLLARE